MNNLPCEYIQEQMGLLYGCAREDDYVRIHTPYLLPDGDHIEIYSIVREGVITLTDYGETLRWLRMQTASGKRTPKQNQLISDICLTHGVEFFKGMLLVRVADIANFAAILTRLAQAILRVADIWFTFRARTSESLGDEVEDMLTERQVPFTRGEKISGRSGLVWTPDFHTRLPGQSSLIYILSTGSRAAAKKVREHVVTAWVDLNHLAVGPEAIRFISLFDDSVDIWSDEDFALLEGLSEIARLTVPEEFIHKLGRAA